MIIKMTAHKSTVNKIMHYANDKAIEKDTYNMNSLYTDSLDKKINEMKELQKSTTKDSRKYYHLIISPEQNEMDKEKLLSYIRELLETKFENCQATISIHNDKPNRLDGHVILNAYKIDGKKIDIKNNEYDKIKTYAQETLAKKYGYQVIEKEQRKYNHKRKTQEEYGLEKRGKQTQTDYIKKTIKEVLRKDNVIDKESFIKELSKYDIAVEQYKGKTQYKTKELKYFISESKLGNSYGMKNITEIMKNKIKLKQEIEKPILDPKDIKNELNDKESIKELKELLKTKGKSIPQKELNKISQIITKGITPVKALSLIKYIKQFLEAQERQNSHERT